MVWSCWGDGDCCELFSPHAIGTQCHMLDENRKCKCYTTRPKNCRVSSVSVPVDINDYLTVRCKLFHALKRIKDECGDTEAFKYILDKIAKSGLR